MSRGYMRRLALQVTTLLLLISTHVFALADPICEIELNLLPTREQLSSPPNRTKDPLIMSKAYRLTNANYYTQINLGALIKGWDNCYASLSRPDLLLTCFDSDGKGTWLELDYPKSSTEPATKARFTLVEPYPRTKSLEFKIACSQE
jgi:hypothetical protein